MQTGTEERRDVLDAHLWTFRDDSFLAHATDREAHSADQPVLLTTAAGNPNAADIRFIVDGAEPPELDGYKRAVFLFDGHDQAQVEARASAVEAAEGGRTTPSPIGSRRPSGAGSARREAGLHRADVPGRAGPCGRLSHAGDEPAAHADRHLAGLCAGKRFPRLRRQAQSRRCAGAGLSRSDLGGRAEVCQGQRRADADRVGRRQDGAGRAADLRGCGGPRRHPADPGTHLPDQRRRDRPGRRLGSRLPIHDRDRGR